MHSGETLADASLGHEQGPQQDDPLHLKEHSDKISQFNTSRTIRSGLLCWGLECILKPTDGYLWLYTQKQTKESQICKGTDNTKRTHRCLVHEKQYEV